MSNYDDHDDFYGESMDYSDYNDENRDYLDLDNDEDIDTDESFWDETDPWDSMDGDHDSAMRDAGFGMDEDYGYYSNEEDY